jgi:hypothetical protein
MSDDGYDDEGQRCMSAALVMPEMVRRCCAYDGHSGEHIWMPTEHHGMPMAFTWSDSLANTDTVTIWSPVIYNHNNNGEAL